MHACVCVGMCESVHMCVRVCMGACECECVSVFVCVRVGVLRAWGYLCCYFCNGSKHTLATTKVCVYKEKKGRKTEQDGQIYRERERKKERP